MRLRDVFIINEGLKDAANRDLADQATRVLIDNVKRIRKPHNVNIDDDGFVAAIYYGWEMSNIPEELDPLFKKTLFFISYVPEGQSSSVAAFMHSSKFKADSLFVYAKLKYSGEMTEAKWSWYVERFGVEILQDKFNPIVHEFIHAFDSKRLSDPEYMDELDYDPDKLGSPNQAEREAERKKYANNPLEFNGIYQQFAHWIEGNIRKAGGLEGLQIRSPRNMVTYGMQAFPTDWVNNLSPELRRHFIKRLNQFYEDMKAKYG